MSRDLHKATVFLEWKGTHITKQTTKLRALGSMLPASDPPQQKCKNGIKIYNKSYVCFSAVTAGGEVGNPHCPGSETQLTPCLICYLTTLSTTKIIHRLRRINMEHRWNDSDRKKTNVLREKLVPLPLCLPQIPHGLTWHQTRPSAVPFSRHISINASEKQV